MIHNLYGWGNLDSVDLLFYKAKNKSEEVRYSNFARFKNKINKILNKIFSMTHKSLVQRVRKFKMP